MVSYTDHNEKQEINPFSRGELAIILLKKTFAMLLLVKCGKSVVDYIGGNEMSNKMSVDSVDQ
jgi:hypothetical protein